MNKIKSFIYENKNYFYGFAFVAVTSAIFILMFFNKSLAAQEGWYTIYARNIIENGLVPYKDFFVVVPPFALYFWTAIQYIFGDYFIVFHIADIFTKIAYGLCLYHIFTKFFSVKISAISALFSQVILIGIIYDNGVLSYNTYWVIMMFVMIIVMLAQIRHIEKFSKPDNKIFILLAITYTLAFFIKQTSGPVNILASLALMLFMMYKLYGIKSIVRPFITMFISSLVSLLVFSGYFIINGAVPYFIKNVFMSYSAKGDVGSIFGKVFSIVFVYDFIWPAFLVFSLVFVFYIIDGRYKAKDRLTAEDNSHTAKHLILSFVLFLITLCIAVTIVKLLPAGKDLTTKNNLFMQQICAVGLFFAFFITLYQTADTFLSKKISLKNYSLFIVFVMFTSSVIIHSVSHGLPNTYPYIAGLICACALSVNTFAGKLKNFAIYVLIVITCLFAFITKLQSPAIFHGWKCGNITQQLFYTNIPKLKGIKLPADEKAMYESFYNEVQKYTNTNDTILSFNNNQVFYDLLERKPYTKYISLYYDVSSDEQSAEIIEEMKSEPPKAIVFLKFSEKSQTFHEKIFRNGNISGQRLLNNFIEDLIEKEEYKVVLKYEAEEKIDETKLTDRTKPFYEPFLLAQNEYNLLKKDKEFNKNMLKDKRDGLRRLKRKMRYAVYKENAFLASGFELMLLIRTDVYDRVNSI